MKYQAPIPADLYDNIQTMQEREGILREEYDIYLGINRITNEIQRITGPIPLIKSELGLITSILKPNNLLYSMLCTPNTDIL